MKPLGHFVGVGTFYRFVISFVSFSQECSFLISLLTHLNLFMGPSNEALCCWIIHYSFASAFQISSFKIPYFNSQEFSPTPLFVLFFLPSCLLLSPPSFPPSLLLLHFFLLFSFYLPFLLLLPAPSPFSLLLRNMLSFRKQHP